MIFRRTEDLIETVLTLVLVLAIIALMVAGVTGMVGYPDVAQSIALTAIVTIFFDFGFFIIFALLTL